MSIKPEIHQFFDQEDLATFSAQVNPSQTHDIYQDLLREHYLNSHPDVYFGSPEEKQAQFDAYLAETSGEVDSELLGYWVYYSWANSLFHLIDPHLYYDLRTMRNRNLITPEDQHRLHQASVSVAGLSVGKNTVLSMARYGIGSRYTLADNDIFELSNANRAMYDLLDYRQPKLTTTAQELYQIDPYLHIDTLTEGLTDETIEGFVTSADIVVDTFDAFPLKLKLRQLAQRHRKPVLSGVDLERGVLVIIERYDQEAELDQSLFLNNLDPSSLQKTNLSKSDITNFFINMIGRELHSPQMLDSVESVGTDLTSYPQLVVASQLLASCLTISAERILLDKNQPSGRYHIDLDQLLA